MGDLTLDVVTFDQYIVGTDAPADGPFPITFAFDIDAADILVRVQEEGEDTFTTLTEGVHYTLDRDAAVVTFITTTYEPGTAATVRIERHTSRVRVVDYEGGSTVTAQNLNNDNKQEFFCIQEIENDLERALFMDPTGSWWEGEGLRSHNCGQATTASGWVTLAQVQAIVDGGDVVNIDSADVFSFVGDGVTTDFELDEHETLSSDRTIVTINGVIQHAGERGSAYEDALYEILHSDDTGYPGTAFTWDVLRFSEPPANGDVIEVRIIKGTVTAVYGSGVITSDSLPDGVLDFRHFADLNQSPASRIVFNPSGEPTFEPVSSIDSFEATLNAWLAAKKLSNFADLIDGPLDMNGSKVTDLASGTASSDAATYGQLLSFRVRVQTRNIGPIFSSGTHDATFDFAPDFVILFGREGISGTNVSAHYFCSFARASDIEWVAGPVAHNLGGQDWVMPAFRFTRTGTGDKKVRVQMADTGDIGSPSFGQAVLTAVKF